jgi:hypothetical protein
MNDDIHDEMMRRAEDIERDRYFDEQDQQRESPFDATMRAVMSGDGEAAPSDPQPTTARKGVWKEVGLATLACLGVVALSAASVLLAAGASSRSSISQDDI